MHQKLIVGRINPEIFICCKSRPGWRLIYYGFLNDI